MPESNTTRHDGETTVYHTCICNCGNTSQCVFKSHIKDGVVIAVEPDDRVNTGVGREDEVLRACFWAAGTRFGLALQYANRLSRFTGT